MAVPKSIALLALGKPKSEADTDEPSPDDEALEMAMQDFLDALEGKDAAGMASAFRHACQMCAG